MLIDLTDLRYKHHMNITGVLHLGAHLGEEAQKYAENGIGNVVWVEGNDALIPPLSAAVAPYGHRVIQALVTDVEDQETVFHITNNGQSSSVLSFGTHPQRSPDVHFIGDQTHLSRTVDSLAREHDFTGLNMINSDLQGAELLALKGAEGFLKQVEFIYTEVNTNYLYEGCVLLHELDAFLLERGFTRFDTQINNAEWGDAIFMRTGRTHG